jgi:hypothetical protein
MFVITPHSRLVQLSVGHHYYSFRTLTGIVYYISADILRYAIGKGLPAYAPIYSCSWHICSFNEYISGRFPICPSGSFYPTYSWFIICPRIQNSFP